MSHWFENNNGEAWQWISFAVIACFVWLVYASSLMLVPRADQIMYLAEVGNKQSLWDLIIGCLDLNRHRFFAPGDEILFRPVDYLLLGLEKYFFGNNFMWGQALGVCFHLGVVWLFLKLCLSIYRGLSAVVFTAFFALLFVNLEMVTWQHINSYMIFVAATLAVLRRFLNIIKGATSSSKDCLVMFMLLFVASLTHELGNVVALVLGLIIFTYKHEHRLLYRSLLLVPPAYLLASLLNAWVHPFNTTLFHQHHPFSIVANGVYAIAAWVYAGFFPFELQWLFVARNMIAPEQHHLIKWPHVFFRRQC